LKERLGYVIVVKTAEELSTFHHYLQVKKLEAIMKLPGDMIPSHSSIKREGNMS